MPGETAALPSQRACSGGVWRRGRSDETPQDATCHRRPSCSGIVVQIDVDGTFAFQPKLQLTLQPDRFVPVNIHVKAEFIPIDLSAPQKLSPHEARGGGDRSR